MKQARGFGTNLNVKTIETQVYLELLNNGLFLLVGGASRSYFCISIYWSCARMHKYYYIIILLFIYLLLFKLIKTKS